MSDWAPLLIALGPSVLALFVALANRPKTRAETRQAAGADWASFTNELQEERAALQQERAALHEQNETCKQRVDQLTIKVQQLDTEVARLRRLLVQNGIDPGDTPDRIQPGL